MGIDTTDEVACFRCEGEGTVECDTCSGRGGRNAHRYMQTGFNERSVEGSFQWETCTECEGTGKVTCPDCLGGELD